MKDKNSALETAKAEGEYERKIKIAQNLLDVFDDKTVANKTELSIEEVRKLREML